MNVGRLLNNLGGLEFLLGKPDEAIARLNEAFAIALEHGNDDDVATAISSLAQVHLRTGEPAQAEEHARARAAAGSATREDRLDEIGNARLVLGRALLEQDRLDEAEAALAEAEDAFAQLSSGSHRAAAWVAQGDLAQRRGDDRRAAALYRARGRDAPGLQVLSAPRGGERLWQPSRIAQSASGAPAGDRRRRAVLGAKGYGFFDGRHQARALHRRPSFGTDPQLDRTPTSRVGAQRRHRTQIRPRTDRRLGDRRTARRRRSWQRRRRGTSDVAERAQRSSLPSGGLRPPLVAAVGAAAAAGPATVRPMETSLPRVRGFAVSARTFRRLALANAVMLARDRRRPARRSG